MPTLIEGQDKDAKDSYAIEKSDITTFASKYLGLNMLHPGGYKASSELAGLCGMSGNSLVLDIACGKGTSSRFFAKKFGCNVTGIDMDEDRLQSAKALSEKDRAIRSRVKFMCANAENLSFADNTFDIVIVQAALYLLEHAEKAMEEAARVTKPGGRVGFLELTWLKEPSNEIIEEAKGIFGRYLTQAKSSAWQDLIANSGLEITEVKLYNYEATTIKDENAFTFLKVLWKMTTNSAIRNKARKNSSFFIKHPGYMGYGLYVGEKRGRGRIVEPEEMMPCLIALTYLQPQAQTPPLK